jgi:predicted ATPase
MRHAETARFAFFDRRIIDAAALDQIGAAKSGAVSYAAATTRRSIGNGVP